MALRKGVLNEFVVIQSLLVMDFTIQDLNSYSIRDTEIKYSALLWNNKNNYYYRKIYGK